MIKLRHLVDEIVSESPDKFINRKFYVRIHNSCGNITFGFYNNVLYSDEDSTHYDIGRLNNLLDDDGMTISRMDFSYPGRLWPSEKIISFWKYPKKSKDVALILSELKKKYPEIGDINSYLVEVPGGYKDWNEFYGTTTPDELATKLNKNNVDVVLIPIKKYDGV